MYRVRYNDEPQLNESSITFYKPIDEPEKISILGTKSQKNYSILTRFEQRESRIKELQSNGKVDFTEVDLNLDSNRGP